ncbi:amino acid ABC transporter substrate-binding protein [Elioraea sp.]|uniref:amino acid ABC transporter substrate-binding protein n=1 Tax=Elioraea sp. TaxID=2185103 RepID=UPI0025C39C36|nr:amino acid ABC transporter substrate-binding protein [Elioraea sp.]
MINFMRAGVVAAAFTIGATGVAIAQQASTFDAVRARGVLNCGVTTGVAGFSNPDSQGVWRGLDVDGCRAVAAALFGDATKVRYVGTTSQNRFPALQSGEVDLLVRTTTWTMAREASLGFQFAGINYYDGQAFMVKRSLGVTSAKQLDGATVCVQPGTTTELNLADYFRTNRMSFRAVVIESIEEIRNAFISGRCDVYTNDSSSLASFRSTQGANAEQYVMLPEIISKEPLGPVVRKGDQKFFDLVRWAFFAQLAAEELGVTSANVDQMLTSQNPEIQRLLGVTGGLGQMMGVDNRWAYNVIKQVGNFEELWERSITPMGVPRGINALWTKGGLMYAPPIR